MLSNQADPSSNPANDSNFIHSSSTYKMIYPIDIIIFQWNTINDVKIFFWIYEYLFMHKYNNVKILWLE